MLKKYWWVLIAIFVVLGIVTLIPIDASKPCLLGYEAHCSFTPISTIICWIIAAIFYAVGKRKAYSFTKTSPTFFHACSSA